MKIFKTNDTQWENRHETFKQDIRNLYKLANGDGDALTSYHAATKGFQQLIQEAIDTNSTLRALGSGWSWTRIAATDGVILDTKSLNTVFEISARSVSPNYTGDRSKLFLAQCGTAVWELSAFLRQRGLSLKTSGASNGQTICGVIATGAHGSAFDTGAVQDFVVGLHIVTGANRHVYLERASYPVVSDSFVAQLGAELKRDDDLFNAALVSFGSFGIIHGVMVETEDLFLLEGYMERRPFDATLRKLISTLDFSQANLPCGNERPYHFQMLINPYDIEKGAYVTTMYKRPFSNGYIPPMPNLNGLGPGDDAPCFVGKLTNAVPGLVPLLVNKLLAGSLTLYNKQMGTLSEMFSNTNLHGKLLSAAIGVPIERLNEVIDLLLNINNGPDGPFSGLFAFRFIKQSNGLLAFTRFPFTCVVELDGAFSDKTQSFYKAVWQQLDAHNIPYTFHWGKMSELTPTRIKKMYGADLDKWQQARQQLLEPAVMKVFTNKVMQEWGL